MKRSTRTRASRGGALAFFLIGCGLTLPAQATERPEDELAARALALGHEALAAFERGDYERSYELFGSAEELLHSPVFLLYRARCLARLGELLRARELYRRVVRQPPGETDPRAWRDAERAAILELEELSSRIVVVVVEVRGPVEYPIRVEGGAAVFLLGDAYERLEFDPGFERAREFVLTDARGRTARARPVTRDDGERLEFTLFEPAPPLVVPRDRSVATRPVIGFSPAARGGPPLAAWISFGLAAGGIAATAVFGGLAFDRAGDVKAGCVNGSCRPQDRPLADEAAEFGRLATVGVAIAVTGTALGVTLWATESPDRRSVAVRVGPDRFELSGHF